MWTKHSKKSMAISLAVAGSFVVGGWSALQAAGQCHGPSGMHQGDSHAGHQGAAKHGEGSRAEGGQQDGVNAAPIYERPPHGGQVTRGQSVYFFEVVYQPRQTRVYLYGPAQEPLTAKGVRGQAVMRVRGQDRDFRFPLEHVRQPAGSREQDYLAATVDVRRIRDGDMTVTLLLENLPYRQCSKAQITQKFALSKPPIEVAVAVLNAKDEGAIARQGACPVTGSPLGSHGTPVKVLLGEQPLYLCCKGCLGKVQEKPDQYLAKAAAPREGP